MKGFAMPASTITSKGQTTIPRDIRKYLNLHAGDKIDFIIGREGKVIIEPATIDAAELEGLLFNPDRKAVSIAEMKSAVKQNAAKKVR
jgi:antitoxin PrlF